MSIGTRTFSAYLSASSEERQTIGRNLRRCLNNITRFCYFNNLSRYQNITQYQKGII